MLNRWGLNQSALYKIVKVVFNQSYQGSLLKTVSSWWCTYSQLVSPDLGTPVVTCGEVSLISIFIAVAEDAPQNVWIQQKIAMHNCPLLHSANISDSESNTEADRGSETDERERGAILVCFISRTSGHPFKSTPQAWVKLPIWAPSGQPWFH